MLRRCSNIAAGFQEIAAGHFWTPRRAGDAASSRCRRSDVIYTRSGSEIWRSADKTYGTCLAGSVQATTGSLHANARRSHTTTVAAPSSETGTSNALDPTVRSTGTQIAGKRTDFSTNFHNFLGILSRLPQLKLPKPPSRLGRVLLLRSTGVSQLYDGGCAPGGPE